MAKDILYYSNFCDYSADVLKYLQSKGLTDRLLYVCVDNRSIHPQTHQIIITLPNGQQTALPVHVVRVPTMMLVNEKNVTIVGRDIITRFEEKYGASSTNPSTTNPSANHPMPAAVIAATAGQGEPLPAADAFKPMGAATAIGGVLYTSTPAPPLFNPAHETGSSNHRIKEGDVTTEQLQAQRELEADELFTAQARAPI